MYKILFICTHNSARSQMAEGLINKFFSNKFLARSAGTHPTTVNPLAIKVLAEIKADISTHTTKNMNQFLKDKFDYVVTVCDDAGEACPFFPNTVKRIHKSFKDPSKVDGNEAEKLAFFRQIRDEILNWLRETFT